jgi:hypothetical protein
MLSSVGAVVLPYRPWKAIGQRPDWSKRFRAQPEKAKHKNLSHRVGGASPRREAAGVELVSIWIGPGWKFEDRSGMLKFSMICFGMVTLPGCTRRCKLPVVESFRAQELAVGNRYVRVRTRGAARAIA